MQTMNTIKKTKGRQKIEIKKIEKASNRQVTFSKRRAGLFKKASELCILTGAEIAIVVHSLGNRVYSFGNPSLEAVVDRFLNEESGGGDARDPTPSADTRDLNMRFSDACKELEAEMKRRDLIEEAKMGEGQGWWWDEAVEGMGLDELEQYGAALEELMRNVTMRADDLMLLQSLNSSPAAENASRNPDMVEAASDEIQDQINSLFYYENFVNSMDPDNSHMEAASDEIQDQMNSFFYYENFINSQDPDMEAAGEEPVLIQNQMNNFFDIDDFIVLI